MFAKLRTHAPLVLAGLALFFAIGGPAFGADAVSHAARLITGKQIKNGSVTTKDVKNGSLLAADFKLGQLSAGAQGPKGDKGEKGDTGTVDTSNFYDKAASDGRYIQGRGRMLFVRKTFGTVAALPVLDVPGWGTFRAYGDVGAGTHRHDFLNQSGESLSVFVDGGAADPTWYVPGDGISASAPISLSTDVVHWTIVRQVDDATQVVNADVASADWGSSFEITVQAVVQP